MTWRSRLAASTCSCWPAPCWRRQRCTRSRSAVGTSAACAPRLPLRPFPRRHRVTPRRATLERVEVTGRRGERHRGAPPVDRGEDRRRPRRDRALRRQHRGRAAQAPARCDDAGRARARWRDPHARPGRRLHADPARRRTRAARLLARLADPEQIERIEILRAPTAETGTRAIAGTINIITREGLRKRINDLKLGVALENGQLTPGLSWTRNDSVDAMVYNLSLSALSLRRDNDSVDRHHQPDAGRRRHDAGAERADRHPGAAPAAEPELAPAVARRAGRSARAVAVRRPEPGPHAARGGADAERRSAAAALRERAVGQRQPAIPCCA